jgi:hypothetical protein
VTPHEAIVGAKCRLLAAFALMPTDTTVTIIDVYPGDDDRYLVQDALGRRLLLDYHDLRDLELVQPERTKLVSAGPFEPPEVVRDPCSDDDDQTGHGDPWHDGDEP